MHQINVVERKSKVAGNGPTQVKYYLSKLYPGLFHHWLFLFSAKVNIGPKYRLSVSFNSNVTDIALGPKKNTSVDP